MSNKVAPVSPDAIEAALERIDSELTTLHHRELVSSSEVADLLLDVRSLLRTSGTSDS